MEIFVECDGQEWGPYSKEEFFALLKEGRFNLDVPARTEGSEEWQSLKTVLQDSAALFTSEQIDSLEASVASQEKAAGFTPFWKWAGLSACFLGAFLAMMSVAIFRSTPPKGDAMAEKSRPIHPSVPIAHQIEKQNDPEIKTAVPDIKPQQSVETVLPVAAASVSPKVIEMGDEVTSDPIQSQSAQPIHSPNSPILAISSPSPAPPEVTDQAAESATTASTTPSSEVAPVAPALPPPPKDPIQPQTAQAASSPEPSALVVATPTPTPEPPNGLSLFAGDFFKIESVKLCNRMPRDGVGVWKLEKKGPLMRLVFTDFLPCLEVKIRVKENTRSDQTLAKAYFYDEKGTLIGSQASPSKAGKKTERTQFALPVLFYKNKQERFFFEIPELVQHQRWMAVIVFGDSKEAQAVCYPQNESFFRVDFPEKKLVMDKTSKRIERKPAMDPLIEYVVHTQNPRQPKITLFLRPPKGVSDAREVKGVMALCMLAGNLDEIKRQLQKEEMSGDYNSLLGFANKHKLAIIAWGSTGLWDPGKNYDDMDKAKAMKMDQSLDMVANAWERGVKELSEKYGIPDRDFLLWGSCGSAQWAQRLCLRKPAYFLAIDIHIPGSFDKPTPEAAKVLWCLTTGELYGGYERTNRFVKECRQLGYPMVYKAIPGLGHAGHPQATELGFKFFEFALTQKQLRDDYDKRTANLMGGTQAALSQNSSPWPEIFQHPPYYGDMVNQEMFPAKQIDDIPAGFRIALPTKDLADIWVK